MTSEDGRSRRFLESTLGGLFLCRSATHVYRIAQKTAAKPSRSQYSQGSLLASAEGTPTPFCTEYFPFWDALFPMAFFYS